MTNIEKLKAIFDKKKEQYGEDSICLSVLDEEIKDVEYLLENGLNKRTATEVFFGTTSSSLADLLIEYLAGPDADGITRCSNKTCPGRQRCLRFYLSTIRKEGQFSFAAFEFKDEKCKDRLFV